MLQNFRTLCLLCSFGALLILAGFFLTSIPLIFQISLLAAGLIVSCFTMYGIVKYFFIKKTEIK